MEKMQKKLDNFISYHGCRLYRMDGSNVLITKDFPCSTPIKNCFWMKPEHTTHSIRTRGRRADEIMEKPLYKNFYYKSNKIPMSYSSDENSDWSDSISYPNSGNSSDSGN